MLFLYFYDLPVYRLSETQYNDWFEQDILSQIQSVENGMGQVYAMPQRQKKSIRYYQGVRHGRWRYNEIIGFIRLHFLGSQVRGEYFSSEKQRTRMSRRKIFQFLTYKLGPEVDVSNNSTNQEIFLHILQYVDRCRCELKKGRYIDTELFESIGPHVDWRTLMGWSEH